MELWDTPESKVDESEGHGWTLEPQGMFQIRKGRGSSSNEGDSINQFTIHSKFSLEPKLWYQM